MNEKLYAEIEEMLSNVDTSMDTINGRNDWIAYITSYIGRAASSYRNRREDQDFRVNMLKAAGLCISAIKAHDNGFC